MARLTGENAGDHTGAGTSDSDPLTRFMYEQLRCIVMDEPWDTSLTWADAQIDLPEIESCDRDRAIAEVLIRLHDEGLACFFEVEDFGESYSRTPDDDEKLGRDSLIRILDVGGRAEGERISAPMLGVRATSKGEQLHFQRNPEDKARLRPSG